MASENVPAKPWKVKTGPSVLGNSDYSNSEKSSAVQECKFIEAYCQLFTEKQVIYERSTLKIEPLGSSENQFAKEQKRTRGLSNSTDEEFPVILGLALPRAYQMQNLRIEMW